jgi:DNA-binding transcriptional ArsR family regulator
VTLEKAERPVGPSLEEVDRVFQALAHEARRQMLILLGQCGGELPSGYLASRFQHSWPTTSRHLKVLEEAGLVDVRRERRGSNYRLNRERLGQVVTGWLRYLEPADPGQRWSPSGPRSTSAHRTPTGTREGIRQRTTERTR